ncbi:MAG: CHAP domain-containing protein [Ktedonobacteraceae bacterium]|nr:CHAP domain-containing protein [Ktedonobacteraceae bacterium]
MLSFDDRSRNSFSPISSQETGQATPFTEPLTQDNSPTPLQDAPVSTNILPAQPSYMPDPQTPLPPSNVTRLLTGTLDGSGSVQRAPVIIRGNLKRQAANMQVAHPRRRKVKSLIGIVVLFVIVSFSLLVSTPLGQTVGLSFNPSSSKMQMAVNPGGSGNTLNSIVAQATATAVYNNQQADGYDPYASTGVSIGSGNSPRPWPYGQCTYWANLYYHQLTGWWVNWAGNADQWVGGAGAAGWNVSTVPHVPSIIVLMPGVQGASYAYGHVAVVTSVIDSSTVMTSNMNWWANGGGWGIVSSVPFNYGPGYGVYFVWHS